MTAGPAKGRLQPQVRTNTASTGQARARRRAAALTNLYGRIVAGIEPRCARQDIRIVKGVGASRCVAIDRSSA